MYRFSIFSFSYKAVANALVPSVLKIFFLRYNCLTVVFFFKASANALIPSLPILFSLRFSISIVEFTFKSYANASAPLSSILFLLNLRFNTFLNNFMIETIKLTLSIMDKSLSSNINVFIFEKS